MVFLNKKAILAATAASITIFIAASLFSKPESNVGKNAVPARNSIPQTWLRIYRDPFPDMETAPRQE